jgi:phosphatidate phosphatase PAH1
MVNHIANYPYSSYAEYIGLNDDQYVDKDFVLSLFHEEKEQALADFRDFNEMATDEKFLDISDRKHISDKAAIDLIKKKYKVASSLELQSIEVEKRAKAVQFLLNKGMSARQIIRVTGISRYFIEKV